jgi:hypothetical protein
VDKYQCAMKKPVIDFNGVKNLKAAKVTTLNEGTS